MGSTTPTESLSRSESLQKLARLTKDIDFAMLTTHDEEGGLRSRPMGTQELDVTDGALWFFTKDFMPKAHEINHNHQVNVAYSDPSGHRYVSVSGRAEIVTDREKIKEYWKPIYRAWYPGGIDEPGICLIKVHIERAEYWDSPSSTMVQLAGFVKALLTKKPLEYAGENRKIRLQ